MRIYEVIGVGRVTRNKNQSLKLPTLLQYVQLVFTDNLEVNHSPIKMKKPGKLFLLSFSTRSYFLKLLFELLRSFTCIYCCNYGA